MVEVIVILPSSTTVVVAGSTSIFAASIYDRNALDRLILQTSTENENKVSAAAFDSAVIVLVIFLKNGMLQLPSQP
jgi:hypothetical protein